MLLARRRSWRGRSSLFQDGVTGVTGTGTGTGASSHLASTHAKSARQSAQALPQMPSFRLFDSDTIRRVIFMMASRRGEQVAAYQGIHGSQHLTHGGIHLKEPCTLRGQQDGAPSTARVNRRLRQARATERMTLSATRSSQPMKRTPTQTTGRFLATNTRHSHCSESLLGVARACSGLRTRPLQFQCPPTQCRASLGPQSGTSG
jgi:hypothetical protein